MGLEFCVIRSRIFQEVWVADFAWGVPKSPIESGFLGLEERRAPHAPFVMVVSSVVSGLRRPFLP